MSDLTDFRDWCRQQANRITDTLAALDQTMPVAGIADPDVRQLELDNQTGLIRDRDLWTDQADAIDRWLNREDTTDDPGLFANMTGLA